MSSQIIGSVKSASGNKYDVKWDSQSKDVFVSYGGWANCGKATSAPNAMNKAEAYLHNK